MSRKIISIVFSIAICSIAFGIGIILPSGELPGTRFSMQDLPAEPIEARIDITIIDNYASLEIIQIFRNPRKYPSEGVLNFPLQDGMEVYGFATWDGPRRIPGVIMEKGRAIRIYEELRDRAIDPGILLPSATNLFTAKIVPIPRFGTKRMEISCGGLLNEIDGAVEYTIPMAPENIGEQIVLERIEISLQIEGRIDIEDISIRGIEIPISGKGKKRYGELKLSDFALPEALTIDYKYPDGAPQLSVEFMKDGDTAYGIALFTPPVKVEHRAKPFMAILTDVSASMAEYMDDIFIGAQIAAKNAEKYFCIVFNDSITRFPKKSFSKDASYIQNISNSIQAEYGTDLMSALERTYIELEAQEGRRAIVFFTDGVPSVGEIGKNAIMSLVQKHKDIPIYVIAIGYDISADLLRNMSERTCGAYIEITEKADIQSLLEQKLIPFLTRVPVRMSEFNLRGTKLLSIYPQNALFYGGIQGIISFSAKKAPQPGSKLLLKTTDGETYEASVGERRDLPFIPRMWANHRIEYLLRRIAEEGEKDEWVNEIIALSKKFTFITPYTAFLAAPRAVLRPRVIQPADPKITIDAPNAIQVIVELPWGEQIMAIRNRATSLWEARFLVPGHVTEGEYECTITITDASGAEWKQKQKLIVDTTPPEIRIEIIPERAHRGQTIELRVYAPQDTRTIFAKTPDTEMIELKWNDAIGASTAEWTLPSRLSTGEHIIRFTATDFAGNQNEIKAKLIVE